MDQLNFPSSGFDSSAKMNYKCLISFTSFILTEDKYSSYPIMKNILNCQKCSHLLWIILSEIWYHKQHGGC